MIKLRVCSFSVLYSVFTLSAGDAKVRRFCTFQQEKIPTNYSPAVCWFSKHNKDKVTITHVVNPPLNEYVSARDFDAQDLYIAGWHCGTLPYIYESIQKTKNELAYVLKEEYEPACSAALRYLHRRRTAFENSLNKEDLNESAAQDTQDALERTKYYIELLETNPISYYHDCVGLIVPMRAVLCAVQWGDIDANKGEQHTISRECTYSNVCGTKKEKNDQ